MIDKAARRLVIDGITKYFSGSITAERLVDEHIIPGVSSDDSTLRSIASDVAVFFSDMHGYSEGGEMTDEAGHVVDVLLSGE